MDIIILLTIWFVSVFKYGFTSYLTPYVAIYENLPAMYKSDNSWKVTERIINKLTNFTEIVQFCKESYPMYNIINAVPIFKTEVITNWCRFNQSCTVKEKYVIHPIECLNSSYTYRPMFIPSHCKFNIYQDRGCLSFHTWKQDSKAKCDENEQNLFNLQTIFPCKDKYMLFSEVEYICCSDRDKVSLYSEDLRIKVNDLHNKYLSTLASYQYKTSNNSEDSVFAKTKRLLINNYLDLLAFLDTDLTEKLKIMIKKDGEMASQSYKDEDDKLYKTFKYNYESLTREFKRELFHLDNIHIKRIMRRSDHMCRNENNSISGSSRCLKELDNISKQIMEHFKGMINLHGLDRQEYLAFIESRLKYLYSRYLPLAHDDKVLSRKFHEQLEKYRLKIESGQMSGNHWLDYLIRRKYNHCKTEAIVYLHNQTHYMSLAPMVVIITMVTFLLTAVMSTLVYRYCKHPFRRGFHNYTMRVARVPSQSGQSIIRPELNLNIYENPIFNSKSSSKHIEKRSLMEYMEN